MAPLGRPTPDARFVLRNNRYFTRSMTAT
jgi:hypothetical protein